MTVYYSIMATVEKRNRFLCPYCDESNYSRHQGAIDHIKAEHPGCRYDLGVVQQAWVVPKRFRRDKKSTVRIQMATPRRTSNAESESESESETESETSSFESADQKSEIDALYQQLQAKTITWEVCQEREERIKQKYIAREEAAENERMERAIEVTVDIGKVKDGDLGYIRRVIGDRINEFRGHAKEERNERGVISRSSPHHSLAQKMAEMCSSLFKNEVEFKTNIVKYMSKGKSKTKTEINVKYMSNGELITEPIESEVDFLCELTCNVIEVLCRTLLKQLNILTSHDPSRVYNELIGMSNMYRNLGEISSPSSKYMLKTQIASVMPQFSATIKHTQDLHLETTPEVEEDVIFLQKPIVGVDEEIIRD